MVSIKGSIVEVNKILSDYKSESPLTDLIELLIEEENENIEAIRALEELITSEPKNGLQILKGRITFKNRLVGTSALLSKGEDIGDFTPVELFEKRLKQDESVEDTEELILAFKEILQKISDTALTN